MPDRVYALSALCLSALLLASGLAYAAWGPPTTLIRPKPDVITLGWTDPDPRALRLNIEWIQTELPFTGTGVSLWWPVPKGGSLAATPGIQFREKSSTHKALGWRVWRRERLDQEVVVGLIEEAKKSAPSQVGRDNYLWLAPNLVAHEVVDPNYVVKETDLKGDLVGSSYFDWFDDQWWELILANSVDLARIAEAGGMKGMIFDGDEYGSIMWATHWGPPRPVLINIPRFKGKSFEDFRAQARMRGRDWIKAVNQVMPEITIQLPIGYSYIYHNKGSYVKKVEDWKYMTKSLLCAFIDGILEASTDQTVVVESCAPSYRKAMYHQLVKLRKIIKEEALLYTEVPEAYKKKVKVGFGFFVDSQNPDGAEWHEAEPDKNFMTPARLEMAVRNGLEVGDGYIWLWSQMPSWWLKGKHSQFPKDSQPLQDHIEQDIYRWIHPDYYRAVERAIRDYRLAME